MPKCLEAPSCAFQIGTIRAPIALVGLRKGARKARGNRRRFGACLGEADARFKPDDGPELPRIALAFAGEWRRNPGIQRDSLENRPEIPQAPRPQW